MNKKAMTITVSTAITTATISVATSARIVTQYRNRFKSLSESISCLNEMRQDFDVTLSPVIVLQSNKILRIVDDNNCDIKQGFNTNLTIWHIMRFRKAGITINVLKELDDEIRKLISYTYMRYGVKQQ